MNRYDILVDNAYLESCTYTNKAGMYPTFDIINKFCQTSAIVDSIIPTTETSEVIDSFADYFGYATIVSYFKNNFGYRNCFLPLSKSYPSLQSIAFRLRSMWAIHDNINKQKFFRLLDTVTNAANISPLYNKHKKWSSDDVVTPNLVDATTGTNTRENDTTSTRTLNISDAKTGTETLQKTNTETHSGQDVVNGSSTVTTANETVNGITAYDRNDFANNDNSLLNGNQTTSSQTSTSYGENIADNGTDTMTFNTTQRNTGTDTNVTDGSISDTFNTRKTKTGTNTKESDGDVWETDISMAEAQKRESAMVSILSIYFNSVMHDLALYTVEEIW